MQLQRLKQSHQQDLEQGYGLMYLPYALERKYLNAHFQYRNVLVQRHSLNQTLKLGQKLGLPN